MVSSNQIIFCALYLWLVVYKIEAIQNDDEVRKAALKNGIDVDNLKPGTIMLTPPKLSDEDEGSQFMPKAHRCSGCKAVAYQFDKMFALAEKKKKKGAILSEAEILEVTEEVCNSEFKDYGLKNVQGENHLSGEGLPANEMSGMIEAGGKWAKRLQNICKEIIGEYEEDGIYSYYRMGGIPLKSLICEDYCSMFTGVRPLKDEF